MADSDVHEAIQLDADISALVSPSVSELWRAMHGYPAEATGAVATHRALNPGGGSLPANYTAEPDHFDIDNEDLAAAVSIGYRPDGTGFISVTQGASTAKLGFDEGGFVVTLPATTTGGIYALTGSAVEVGDTYALVSGAQAYLGDAGGQIGFFGQTPASQPAAPVTLDDVIAALKALGLVAT